MISLAQKDSEVVVISLGGSLVAPDLGPDAEFLAGFRDVINASLDEGKRFYIIVGGGRVCRKYQDALKVLGQNTKETLDYMGIFTTHFNAHYVNLAFGLDPAGKVVLKPENILGSEKLHITGAGLKPGQSSDTPTIHTAIKVGAKRVFNLSNVTQVYSADPKKDPDAKPIDNLSWEEYRSIIPESWTPGLSTPFDPIAAKLASENGISVVILGPDLSNFKKALHGEDFLGTMISDDYGNSTKE